MPIEKLSDLKDSLLLISEEVKTADEISFKLFQTITNINMEIESLANSEQMFGSVQGREAIVAMNTIWGYIADAKKASNEAFLSRFIA